MGLLSELHREGTTIVMVTHSRSTMQDMPTASSICSTDMCWVRKKPDCRNLLEAEICHGFMDSEKFQAGSSRPAPPRAGRVVSVAGLAVSIVCLTFSVRTGVDGDAL